MGAPLSRLVALGAFDLFGLSVPAFNHEERADWPVGVDTAIDFIPPPSRPRDLFVLVPHTICAWCHRVLVAGDPARGMSHGLCDDCFTQIDREGGRRS